MKLQCFKCGRVVQVRARDVREVGATVEPWDGSDRALHATHLACPFCVVERGGTYWLERACRGDAA
jgi:hypothetical protein